MILARNSITLHHLRDITAVVWYYKLQSSTASAPAKPTKATPSGWTTTEPTYTEGSTNSLYVCQKTTFSDGSFEYSDVSLSSSYEASKAAYAKSVQAKETADAAQEDIDNLEIGGRNLLLKTAVAKTATGEYVTNYSQSNYAKELLSGNTDDYFTASFDFVATGDFSTYTSKPYFYVQVNGSATSPSNNLYITEAQSGHYVSTFKLTAAQASSTSGTARIRLRYIPSGCGYTITNFKLEKGNRATDWTPAPEDVEADINEAKKTANNYISADNTGLMVANMADGNTYTPSNVPSGTKNTFIDEDSFQVRDGTDVLASFGETSQIGKDTANHQVIDTTGIKGINADGDTIFDIDMDSGLRMVPEFTRVRIENPVKNQVDMTTLTFTPVFPNIPAEAVDGRELQWLFKVIFTKSDNSIEESYCGVYVNCGKNLTRHGSSGSITSPIRYDYRFTYTSAYSSTSGENECTATYTIRGVSTDYVSIEYWCEFYDYYRPTYIKAPAFSLGTRFDETIGAFSGIVGEGLSAQGVAQFACGRYNEYDSDYAFMVGNGDINKDSNAFAVTWDGNQLLALDETATSGTDAELYSAITSLGWESEVLV